MSLLIEQKETDEPKEAEETKDYQSPDSLESSVPLVSFLYQLPLLKKAFS